MNRQDLTKRVRAVACELMREKGYIAFVDLFIALGMLDREQYENWRHRRVPYLERVIRGNLNKISFIMKLVRRDARENGLKESWTAYRPLGKGKKFPLQFSKFGAPAIERTYATHFVSKRARQEAATSRLFSSGQGQTMICERGRVLIASAAELPDSALE